MGPAFETFVQALFLIALIAIPTGLMLRTPLRRLVRRLYETDRKQLEVAEEKERERKEEEDARLRAIDELHRDCYAKDSPKEDVELHRDFYTNDSPKEEDELHRDCYAKDSPMEAKEEQAEQPVQKK